MTLNDLKNLIENGRGNVIVINNLTIDNSRHLTIVAQARPAGRPLYPWSDHDLETQRRDAELIQERWANTPPDPSGWL